VQVAPGVQMTTSETPSGVQVTTSEGGSGVQRIAPEPSVREPSGRRREPSGISTRAKPRRPLDPTAELSDLGRAKATELGCLDPDEGWREFRSYWVGDGKLKADWEMTWENHMRKCHVIGTFQCPCGVKASKPVGGNPGVLDRWEKDRGHKTMRRAG